MAKNAKEEKFTTIRIRRQTRELLESISFPREVLWETIDRIAKEFAATRLKRGKDDE